MIFKWHDTILINGKIEAIDYDHFLVIQRIGFERFVITDLSRASISWKMSYRVDKIYNWEEDFNKQLRAQPSTIIPYVDPNDILKEMLNNDI